MQLHVIMPGSEETIGNLQQKLNLGFQMIPEDPTDYRIHHLFRLDKKTSDNRLLIFRGYVFMKDGQVVKSVHTNTVGDNAEKILTSLP